MAAIELDIEWPFVYSKFDGEQSLEDFDRYIEEFKRAVHVRREPWVGVNWLKRYTTARPAVQRMASWMKESEENARQYCVATAMVTKSVGFRFVLSSVLLIRPLVMPYIVCATFDEAVAFLRGHADKRKLLLPPIVRKPWADAP